MVNTLYSVLSEYCQKTPLRLHHYTVTVCSYFWLNAELFPVQQKTYLNLLLLDLGHISNQACGRTDRRCPVNARLQLLWVPASPDLQNACRDSVVWSARPRPWSMRTWDPVGVMGKSGLFTLHFLLGFCLGLIYALPLCTAGLLFGARLGKCSITHFTLKQWILMRKRKLAPHLTTSLTLRWEAWSKRLKLEKKSDVLFGIIGSQLYPESFSRWPFPHSPPPHRSSLSPPARLNTVCT